MCAEGQFPASQSSLRVGRVGAGHGRRDQSGSSECQLSQLQVCHLIVNCDCPIAGLQLWSIVESKSLQRNTVYSDRASCFATNVNEWASVGFDSGAFSEISKVQNARQALDRWYQHMSALYMARMQN